MKVKTVTRISILLLLLTGCYNKQLKEKNIFHYNEFNGLASLDPAFAKSQSVM